MSNMLVCAKCNRVKIGDAEWSQNPSSKIDKDSKGVEVAEVCTHCEKAKSDTPQQTGTAESEVVVDASKMKDRDDTVATADKVADEVTTADKVSGDKQERIKPSKPRISKGPKMVDVKNPSEKYVKKDVVSVSAEKMPSSSLDRPGLAYENHKTIIACKRLMGQALIDFANAIRASKENRYYEFYADSWEAYLSTSDIGIDRTRASRLMILSVFCEDYEKQTGKKPEINDIAEARICRHLLPCIQMSKDGTIENIKDAESLIDKAKELGHEDFVAECDDYRNKTAHRGDAPLPEKRLDEGPIKDAQGNVIGQITSVYANPKNHYLKIRIDNDHVLDDEMIIVIP